MVKFCVVKCLNINFGRGEISNVQKLKYQMNGTGHGKTRKQNCCGYSSKTYSSVALQSMLQEVYVKSNNHKLRDQLYFAVIITLQFVVP